MAQCVTSDRAYSSTLFFKRDRPNNPFRDATFVYVPYCTGDMHSGNTTHEYQYKYQLADAPKTTTVHFAGSTNIDAYLAYLVAHYPNAKKNLALRRERRRLRSDHSLRSRAPRFSQRRGRLAG